jgi:hypothetical protein
MKSSYILVQSTGLSGKQVKLGRLVTNIWTPFDSFHDPPSLFTSDLEQIDEITNHNSTLYFNCNRDDSLSLKISKLFGISLNRTSNWALLIRARSVSTTTLLDSTATFNRVFNHPTTESSHLNEEAETRRWIQNRFEGGEAVYMVVGIQAVTDAKVTHFQASNLKQALHGGIPVTDIAAHGVPALVGWSALDVSIVAALARDSGAGSEYEIQGTRVVAVQYCKIKLSLRRWQKDEEVKLADRTWQWYLGEIRASPENNTSKNHQSCFGLEVLLGEIVDISEARNVSEGDSGGHEGEDEDCVDSISVSGVEFVF